MAGPETLRYRKGEALESIRQGEVPQPRPCAI